MSIRLIAQLEAMLILKVMDQDNQISFLNYHTRYKGLAIELKTPTGLGVISKNQQNYINVLENNGFKTLISNNYDEIITTIIKYSMGVRYLAGNTKRKFRSIATRDRHLKAIG